MSFPLFPIIPAYFYVIPTFFYVIPTFFYVIPAEAGIQWWGREVSD